MEREFDLWLEFEEWEPTEHPAMYFNMEVRLADGRGYALCVWLVACVDEILREERESGEWPLGEYAIGPDLIVRTMERGFMEAVVRDLLARGQLREQWRIPPEANPPNVSD
jgi:hypothetical protein